MKVAVFGDPMEDVYWVGTADRLCPEAPIPVVKIEDKLCFPGGAANVTANLEALGAKVVKGYDSLECPRKNRLIVNGQQLARWDEWDSCLENFLDVDIEDVDAVVVSDYGKGGVTYKVWQKLIESGKLLFVDTKSSPWCWWTLSHRAIVFPNQKEYKEYTEDYNAFKLCVLKKGAAGLELRSFGAKWLSVPAKARKVVSVNGAGDTVLAAFVVRYLEDKCEESKANRAAQWANIAAAVAVEKPYTSVVTKEEIKQWG